MPTLNTIAFGQWEEFQKKSQKVSGQDYLKSEKERRAMKTEPTISTIPDETKKALP